MGAKLRESQGKPRSPSGDTRIILVGVRIFRGRHSSPVSSLPQGPLVPDGVLHPLGPAAGCHTLSGAYFPFAALE